MSICLFFFFFQAEDGIRDGTVTGVQTCALPISRPTCSRSCHDGDPHPRSTQRLDVDAGPPRDLASPHVSTINPYSSTGIKSGRVVRLSLLAPDGVAEFLVST